MLMKAIERYPLPLASLRLSHTSISDISMASIGLLVTLTELNLSNTRITNEGLEHLAPLTQLTSLDLCRTRVTQNGLCNLYGLKELMSLYLTKWRFPDFSGLAENLPGCTIKHSYDPVETWRAASEDFMPRFRRVFFPPITSFISVAVRHEAAQLSQETTSDPNGCNVHSLLGKEPFRPRSLKSTDAKNPLEARGLRQRQQRYFRDHQAQHSRHHRSMNK